MPLSNICLMLRKQSLGVPAEFLLFSKSPHKMRSFVPASLAGATLLCSSSYSAAKGGARKLDQQTHLASS